MVNETPEENFLEFSIKYLDAVFGTSDTPEVTLTSFDIGDPNKPKILQPHDDNSNICVPPPRVSSKEEQVKELQSSPPSSEGISVENEKASSENTLPKDNNVSSSTEKFAPVVQSNGESKENSSEKRNSGLIDATLKRKSIIDLESIEFDNNAEPITEELHIETDNPSHLFWVPAHLHPEIAPNEFRKWLKNHKDGFNSGTTSLRRRKSTLSRQYIPMENDDDEIPETKVDTEIKGNGFDWDKFAASVENISPTSESSKLNVIKRSLSLNFPPFMGKGSKKKLASLSFYSNAVYCM